MTAYVEIDPLSDGLWDRLARSTSESDVFHSVGWLNVLKRTYGFDLGAGLVMRGGDPLGGAVFTDVCHFDHAERKVLAFSDFCDPLVGGRDVWDALSEGLLSSGRTVTMRCRSSAFPHSDDRFRTKGKAAWHRCDLARPTGEIWDSLHPSARRAVRKAQASGIEVRAAQSGDDLRQFFLLHLEVRASKYGMLAQPYAFFGNIWSEFVANGRGELLLAWAGDRVVGGTMYLDWGDTSYYKFNASDADTLGVRPNDLLLWAGIESAKARGMSWLDFGVSDLDQPGLIRFKEKYATETGEVVTFEAGPPVVLSDSQAAMRALIGNTSRLLAEDHVPRDVTERSGELFYRYFA